MLTPEHLESLPAYRRMTIPTDYLDDNGHLNIRWYVALIDEAVWAMLAAHTMDAEFVQREQQSAVAMKQYLHYLAEIQAGDTVAVRTRLLARTDKRLHKFHFIVNESRGEITTTCEILASWVDLSTRRSAPFPQAVAAALDATLAQHNQLDWQAPLTGLINL